MSLILGIETSCDETAASVVADGVSVCSNVIATQHALHEKFGGVVPEIASRAHLERILPVLESAVHQAGVTFNELDAIAVGNRPGLIGSLLVGVSAAKALAWALGKPIIGVDHVQAHLYAGRLEEGRSGEMKDQQAGNEARAQRVPRVRVPVVDHLLDTQPRVDRKAIPESSKTRPRLVRQPIQNSLGLVVSGGHTSLYEVCSPTELVLLGRTIDDAVGEAYDKAAVILGVPYPGGPNVDRLAQQAGDMPRATTLPRSLLGPGNLDFSFSGLKTALLYAVRGVPQGRREQSTFARSSNDLTDSQRIELAAAFQEAAIDTLIIKLKRALDHMQAEGRPAEAILLGGGVSANSLLRQRVMELGAKRKLPVSLPAMAFCLDNAAMIAGLAHHLLQLGRVDDLYLPALASAAM